MSVCNEETSSLARPASMVPSSNRIPQGPTSSLFVYGRASRISGRPMTVKARIPRQRTLYSVWRVSGWQPSHYCITDQQDATKATLDRLYNIDVSAVDEDVTDQCWSAKQASELDPGLVGLNIFSKDPKVYLTVKIDEVLILEAFYLHLS
jgi:hypothetical protein